MKGWRLVGNKKLEFFSEEPTELTEHMVKVKIEKAQLSNLDKMIYDGERAVALPLVMGRNAVGVVSRLYDDNSGRLAKMDKVVIESFLPCFDCSACADNRSQYCENMVELGVNTDGIYQNFVDLSEAVLHKLPDSISMENALFVGNVAFCINILDNLNVKKGQHMAIYSNSKEGVILGQLASYYQAIPILISENDKILELARKYGVFYTINSNVKNVSNEVLTITGGRMCSKIIYMANSEYSIKDILECSAVNGTVCIGGYASGKTTLLSLSHIIENHLNIIGTYNGYGSYPTAINLISTGKVSVDFMYGEQVPFDKLDEALANFPEEDLSGKVKIVTID
ncbi:MAG: alcohol dehydrogenase catalytic domain-containing protein [Clostridia bacterium]